MEAQPGVVQPQSYPWRNLTSRPENNGQIINPVGFGDYGQVKMEKSSLLSKPETGSSGRSATGHLKGR